MSGNIIRIFTKGAFSFLIVFLFFSCDNSASDSSYQIGDTGPAGGIIFYINPDAETDDWTCLEAAASDQSTSQIWSDVDGSLAGTATGVGTGKTNTAAIIAQGGHTESAAKVCDDYSVTNEGTQYDDWFLPSRDELILIYINLHDRSTPLGGFPSDLYHSSSERDTLTNWEVNFSDGFIYYNYGKTGNYERVRAIRSF